MAKRRMKYGIVALMLFVVACAVIYRTVIVQKSVYTDDNSQTISHNPLIGYAVSADYPEAVGDSSLVYINVTWREIEPQEGVYDFTAVLEKNCAEKYAALGKHAVFRFLCDVPGQEEHMDIPQWLYDRTGDGTFYDTDYGKGYSPDYSNSDFIEAHGRILEKIAETFEAIRPGFLSYVQLGSLGHWGEWHVKADEGIVPLPTQTVCMQYVDQYRKAFAGTQLMMRRPFLGVKEYGLGVYNDMTGDVDDTQEWLNWLNNGGVYTEPADTHTLYAIPDFYKKAAVGGEFTSAKSWEELLVTDMDTTKQLICQSHMSFIGPMVPHKLEAPQFQKEAEEISELLGYKLGISLAVVKWNRWTDTWKVSVTWNNQGIAPMYMDWPVYLYFYDDEGIQIEKRQIDMKLSSIMPDGELIVQSVQKIEASADVAQLWIGIEDEMTGEAAVVLNNEGLGKKVKIYDVLTD